MFIYYPSTKKRTLAVGVVILVVAKPAGNYVSLQTTDTDWLWLYSDAVYGFRVKSLKQLP